ARSVAPARADQRPPRRGGAQRRRNLAASAAQLPAAPAARQPPARGPRRRPGRLYRLPRPRDWLPLLPGQFGGPPPPAGRNRRDCQNPPHQVLPIDDRPLAEEELGRSCRAIQHACPRARRALDYPPEASTRNWRRPRLRFGLALL